MDGPNQIAAPPRVRLVGQFDHADFADVCRSLRNSARVVLVSEEPHELTIVAQSRAGAISADTIESLRRAAPLSGIVALLGTWCEGETRTGRAWPGVERLYWYEFPAWWCRQLALRAAGRCPDWARPSFDCGLRIAQCELRGAPIRNPESTIRNPCRGLIVFNTSIRDTAAALGDVLHHAGYATLWQVPFRPAPILRGVTAGIWDGGQLNECEEASLLKFCRKLQRDGAPVIALLDFPRRDRCQRARELGAAAVLGKPWLNADLLTTIEELTLRHAFSNTLRAA